MVFLKLLSCVAVHWNGAPLQIDPEDVEDQRTNPERKKLRLKEVHLTKLLSTKVRGTRRTHCSHAELIQRRSSHRSNTMNSCNMCAGCVNADTPHCQYELL